MDVDDGGGRENLRPSFPMLAYCHLTHTDGTSLAPGLGSLCSMLDESRDHIRVAHGCGVVQAASATGGPVDP